MAEKVEVTIIGWVKSEIKTPSDPFKMRESISKIVIDEEFEEGLYLLEKSKYIHVFFNFHLSEEPEQLKHMTYSGHVKGVFASRSPRRPGAIGMTTVKLLSRDGRFLTVKGLDAVDGTPIIDIKPYSPLLDEKEQKLIEIKINRQNPRKDIMKFIRNWELEPLMDRAGEIHGHYCVGLALGIMMGSYAMKFILKEKRNTEDFDGMEKLLAIVEMNNCASDGIQYVTGCSFGNNALIFRDFGKMALTLVDRNGKGVRVYAKTNFRNDIIPQPARLEELFNKVIKNRKGTEQEMVEYKELAMNYSFDFLKNDFEAIFNTEEVVVQIPEYAPIHGNFICDKCGEQIMASRKIEKNNQNLCIPCANAEYFELTGFGMHKKQ